VSQINTVAIIYYARLFNVLIVNLNLYFFLNNFRHDYVSRKQGGGGGLDSLDLSLHPPREYTRTVDDNILAGCR